MDTDRIWMFYSEEDDEHSVAGQLQGQHYFEEDDDEHSAGQVQGQGHRWFHWGSAARWRHRHLKGAQMRHFCTTAHKGGRVKHFCNKEGLEVTEDRLMQRKVLILVLLVFL